MENEKELFSKGGAPGPGRPKGLKNKATLEIRAAIDEYFAGQGGSAKYFVEKLVSFMVEAETDQTRLAALRTLIEYRFGKPTESIEVSGLIDIAERLRDSRERLRSVS